eukprot:CAMPEP_0178960730 /NCGR_PEP_ID=MMETSP0789-20121207/13146_1 /TAXON_ID=3005 /ORGANISM="Rhizosolenia setigera, Strain CCMP 1694" /LENGTH=465 /DNA_ID=CAMNT_0020644151 /DNA_START=74 /DNA_END=1471 /DNA_ORIENTATION=+
MSFYEDELQGPDLSHPDSLIRLVSTVTRMQCPEIISAKNLSFEKSFKSVAKHPSTKTLMTKADRARTKLADSLVQSRVVSSSSEQGKIHQQAVVGNAKEYLPLLHQILLSCKVQSEVARLNKRLIFEWTSGLETKKRPFASEALMYELIMIIATEGVSTGGMACDNCMDGDFLVSSRNYQKAAGIFQFLAEDQIPKWISRGSDVEDSDLPNESVVGVCEAFSLYYLATAQQMAVANVLSKPGTPNYGLLSKLTLAISEKMTQFVSAMRTQKAALQMSRIDPAFFTICTFQIYFQKAISMYFQARSIWDKGEEYGLAISMLEDSMNKMKTREYPASPGIPEISKKSPMKAVENDLISFRSHMRTLHTSWDSDNSKVYFMEVPSIVPEDRKVTKGIHISKVEVYALKDVEPVHFGGYDEEIEGRPSANNNNNELPPPPSYSSTMDAKQIADDEALARELSRSLNVDG